MCREWMFAVSSTILKILNTNTGMGANVQPRNEIIDDLNKRLRELMAALAICSPEYRQRYEQLIAQTEQTRNFCAACFSEAA